MRGTEARVPPRLLRAFRRSAAFGALGRVLLRLVRVRAEPRSDTQTQIRACLGPIEAGRVTLVTQPDPADPLHGHWLMALSVEP
ncbi:MAG: hypothetical protein FJX72_17010 [Armatimonadetes bacterium]|nr:hypothetical protein [Armatimonadota bacterium]